MKKEDQKNVDSDRVERDVIVITIVVNGTPTKVKVNIHAPLKEAVERALQQTGNTGRPVEDWELKWKEKVLDIHQSAEHYRIQNGAELFLSLKAGHGG